MARARRFARPGPLVSGGLEHVIRSRAISSSKLEARISPSYTPTFCPLGITPTSTVSSEVTSSNLSVSAAGSKLTLMLPRIAVFSSSGGLSRPVRFL